ncbi:hypothetical protein HGRIS_007259 [Hohenbuehelia grisea]|uniref:FCH domain-containing protein n=1 Tax=Hohenbuehelia grisea TaxID=104357 RepID=A0ABR3JBJ1_9AGAR
MSGGELLLNPDTQRDFCNTFSGPGDAGVNFLLAHMHCAAQTTEELRNFWRQRTIIEEEYASRLAVLSKSVIGKDEIG